MRKVVIILLVNLLGFCVSAQDSNIVNVVVGKVVEADGITPLAYTNIGLEGTYYGTASDVDGNFELKIPKEFAGRQIFFSVVGYKNKMFPVAQLVGNEFNTITLELQSYDIEDIDINATSKVLFRILRTASENISRNFLKGPMNLICSFEHVKEVDTTKFFRSATINIFDKTGYSLPSKEDAFKNRNYSFSNIEKNFESYSLTDGSTNMDEIIDLDLARSVSSILNPVNLKRFNLILEEETVLNNDDVWVIGFKQLIPDFEGSGDFYATQFEGKIYINKNNYAVKKIEGWVKSDKNNRAGRGLAIGANTTKYFHDVAYDFSTSYTSKGLEFIILRKNYLFGNKNITENTKLIVKSINTSNVKEILSRDFFEGE